MNVDKQKVRGNEMRQQDMISRGKGTVLERERPSYHPDVHVRFQPSAWADEPTILSSWGDQVQPFVDQHYDGHGWILFMDSLGVQRKKRYIDKCHAANGRAAFGPRNLTHMWAPIDRRPTFYL